MKIYSFLTTSVLVLCLSGTLSAQRFNLLNGTIPSLNGQTSMNVEFTYDKMSVGKFDEADYIKKRTEEINGKEAGKGDKWAKAWIDDRKARFEPRFTEMFEKESGMKVGSSNSSKYTIIFNTSFTEPGYNVGVMKKNAFISGTFKIVETADKSKVLATVNMEKAPGRTFMGISDFDTGERLSESYEVAGKRFAKFIMK